VAQSTLDEVRAWLDRKGGLVRTLEESLLQNACRELGWRYSTASQERLRHLLYEMAARRMVVLEFHPDDPSRIVMVCLAEMSEEAVQMATLRRQAEELHATIASLRTQLQAAAPDSAAALQLAQEAEEARQLLQDQLAEAQRELLELRATIQEEIRQVRAAHPRAQDRRKIRDLTRTLTLLRAAQDDDQQELARLGELAGGIPGYQTQIRELTEEVANFRNLELHRLMCGCIVARITSQDCTFKVEGQDHPWFPVVIPGVTDPQVGYAMLATMLAGHALRNGEETWVIMNDAAALGPAEGDKEE